MFAERFDALMNIAGISNSLLGRSISMNASHIGRLRSGARPLPKKHEYLSAMCRYLATHIRKDYQITALQKLTGITGSVLSSPERTVLFLEQWLLEQDGPPSSAGRIVSGYSHSSNPLLTVPGTPIPEAPKKISAYLYGNAGKRKAVEQFFQLILQEDKPQTLLLYSDENMAWLYEDAAFAERWADLFLKVIRKGNKVKIIHTVSRNMNEMVEAVSKWIPIYMTGMVEPYCYSRLRDGIFQRTLFIAPNTAAVIASSVQQNCDGMLNLFLTDKAALEALSAEYKYFLALCRPLMRMYTDHDAEFFRKTADHLAASEGFSYLCSAMPPLFTMPEQLVRELSERTGNEALTAAWKQSFSMFTETVRTQSVTLVLMNPEYTLLSADRLRPSIYGLFSGIDHPAYTEDQYRIHISRVREMEKLYDNLKVVFVNGFPDHTQLYVKENKCVIMVMSGSPETAFVLEEKNMISAFCDYIEKRFLI